MNNVLKITKVNPSKELIGKLEALLANMQIFYTNLRALHWHIEGKQFFELHKQYENLYDEMAEQIDEVAERLLQLGAKPENRFSEYLKISSIKEIGKVSDAKEGIAIVEEGYGVLISLEREIIDAAEPVKDEVTTDLMVGFLGGQEKLIWMLNAYKG